ncbi:MAG: hypothetical protein B9S34_01765 [Opitutia bacterium Tous-C1TDCM]|nr:MAG: hypothetical protein B9S34_01765 [Opitutae bacterium Tous-C1TDCM]
MGRPLRPALDARNSRLWRLRLHGLLGRAGPAPHPLHRPLRRGHVPVSGSRIQLGPPHAGTVGGRPRRRNGDAPDFAARLRPPTRRRRPVPPRGETGRTRSGGLAQRLVQHPLPAGRP